MKIAIVHNDYGKFSGEEAVVRDHIDLLSSNGCKVVSFRRSSQELHGLIGAAKGFFSGIWNPVSQKHFACFLDRERPDIIHIHNLYPLINPCILPEAKRRGIPIVMTVHNYRLLCPNGLFTIHNQICEECAIQKSILPCLKRNCLHSPLKTLGYALRTVCTQKNRWFLDCVDRFLCLTEFQKRKLISYGIPKEKCRVIPNFITFSWLDQASHVSLGQANYVAYAGRLSEEKGIDLLLNAAKKLPKIPFLLAGNDAEQYKGNAPANVQFTGYLTGNILFEFMRNARLQIMTSRCYENFPTSLLQGMALGIPALVPNLGGMPEIIRGAGESFEFEHLVDSIQSLYHDPERLKIYREGALRRIQDFSPEVCRDLLLRNYQECLNEKNTKEK